MAGYTDIVCLQKGGGLSFIPEGGLFRIFSSRAGASIFGIYLQHLSSHLAIEPYRSDASTRIHLYPLLLCGHGFVY